MQRNRGIFFFVGPVTMILALIFEWILGNFFSMMVMGLFSVFWLSFGLLEVPNLALGVPFATPEDPMGTASTEYNAAIGLYLIVWGFAFFTFFIFTTKINAVLATIFSLTAVATWILAAAYLKASWGDFNSSATYQKVSPLASDK
jgi:succinate-acetate transporter protein